jgi:hypothetical protein
MVWLSGSYRFVPYVYRFVAAVGDRLVCLYLSDQGGEVGGAVSVDGEMRDSYKIAVENPESGRTTCEI